ncbi:MAG: hypothetical protein BroJett011_78280 [Chloroflexota bacterium]|nr:hypothetical protein [Chloroflexota bacterium]NOG75302.1 hypothetical protein [Chloroflexota bacterium]GIK43995.1 MAG: hypothetical protein BroJett011_78280 [Chloroflexota bacterium]
MANISVTAAKVRLPNETEVLKIRGKMGAASLAPGMPVYLDGSSGWKAGDADIAAASQVRGLLVSLPNGSVSSAVGDVGDIVTQGRVTGFSGMTPGAAVFVSLDAGSLTQTAPPDSGDFMFAVGWAESAETIYVHPQIVVPSANAS